MIGLAALRKDYPEVSLRAFAKLVSVAYWRLRDFIKREKARQIRARKQAWLKAQVNRMVLKQPTYGYRCIYLELKDQGIQIGKHKVRQLLAELQLNPPPPRKRRSKAKVTPVQQ